MAYNTISLRDKVGDVLNELDNGNIFVIDSDLAKSTTSAKFRDEHPERFVECGISEASAMSIASGLAMEGKIAFYVNFSIFLTGTAWTQLRQACYGNLNVKLIGTHPGMDDGPDGASHHSNEDIALSRVLPNLKVLVPASLEELKDCVEIAINHNGPVFIRCSRDVVPVLEDVKHEKTELGKAKITHDSGNDVALIYEGTAALIAVEAYDALKEKGIGCKLVNISSIKPIDSEMICKIAKEVKGMVTIENHTVIGGLGGAVAEVLSTLKTHPRLERVGVEDVFTESGKISDVKAKYGLNVNHVIDMVNKALAE